MSDYIRGVGIPATIMSNQGSTQIGTRKFRKGDRSRRMWTDREEEVLVASLMELVALGWKSDNGFRAGYLKRIEENLAKEVPLCNLRGTPHVTSKIAAWKKLYGSLQNILSRSGVGFNDHGDYKIDCSDEQWEQIVKVDNNAKLMRNKPWPYWYKWQVIFGKYRATGQMSEDIADASYHQNGHNQPVNLGDDEAYYVNMEEIFTNEHPEAYATTDSPGDSSVQSGKSKSSGNKSGTKRKAPAPDTALMEFLGNLHAETNARLEVISERIGYEFDLGKARHDAFNMLGKVAGITRAERFQLCNILGNNSQQLEIFIGMPSEDKPDYVRMLLDLNSR